VEQTKERMLIVEDEAFLRDLYVDVLSPEGYIIDSAADGEEAFNKIQKQEYDIILLDIILPRMSAYQILEKLNADPNAKNKSSVILLLTNLDNDSDIKRGLSLGAKAYLMKAQLTSADLIKEINYYIQKAKEEKAAQMAQAQTAA